MKEKLEQAYLKEKPRLIGWLNSRLGSEEAEDILHDVIVRSLVNLDSLEGVRDLTAWLWQAARNAVIDAWRKRARRKTLVSSDAFEDLVDARLEGVESALEREEILAALNRAIVALPEKQREVIESQALAGETFRELSKRTGTKIETLAARKRYALESLSLALKPYRE
jgi:RNA polymerase sigma factor (sigma-70 family)